MNNIRNVDTDIYYTVITPDKLEKIKGEKKWTVYSDSNVWGNAHPYGLYSCYSLENHSSSNRDRFEAFVRVLKAIAYLTRPMWDEKWQMEVHDLWWGIKRKAVAVKITDSKLLLSADIHTAIWQRALRITDLIDLNGKPQMGTELLFSQLFGEGSFNLANDVNFIKLFKGFNLLRTWDIINVGGRYSNISDKTRFEILETQFKLLDLLQQYPEEQRQKILTLTLYKNSGKTLTEVEAYIELVNRHSAYTLDDFTHVASMISRSLPRKATFSFCELIKFLDLCFSDLDGLSDFSSIKLQCAEGYNHKLDSQASADQLKEKMKVLDGCMESLDPDILAGCDQQVIKMIRRVANNFGAVFSQIANSTKCGKKVSEMHIDLSVWWTFVLSLSTSCHKIREEMLSVPLALCAYCKDKEALIHNLTNQSYSDIERSLELILQILETTAYILGDQQHLSESICSIINKELSIKDSNCNHWKKYKEALQTYASNPQWAIDRQALSNEEILLNMFDLFTINIEDQRAVTYAFELIEQGVIAPFSCKELILFLSNAPDHEVFIAVLKKIVAQASVTEQKDQIVNFFLKNYKSNIFVFANELFVAIQKLQECQQQGKAIEILELLKFLQGVPAHDLQEVASLFVKLSSFPPLPLNKMDFKNASSRLHALETASALLAIDPRYFEHINFTYLYCESSEDFIIQNQTAIRLAINEFYSEYEDVGREKILPKFIDCLEDIFGTLKFRQLQDGIAHGLLELMSSGFKMKPSDIAIPLLKCSSVKQVKQVVTALKKMFPKGTAVDSSFSPICLLFKPDKKLKEKYVVSDIPGIVNMALTYCGEEPNIQTRAAHVDASIDAYKSDGLRQLKRDASHKAYEMIKWCKAKNNLAYKKEILSIFAQMTPEQQEVVSHFAFQLNKTIHTLLKSNLTEEIDSSGYWGKFVFSPCEFRTIMDSVEDFGITSEEEVQELFSEAAHFFSMPFLLSNLDLQRFWIPNHLEVIKVLVEIKERNKRTHVTSIVKKLINIKNYNYFSIKKAIQKEEQESIESYEKTLKSSFRKKYKCEMPCSGDYAKAIRMITKVPSNKFEDVEKALRFALKIRDKIILTVEGIAEITILFAKMKEEDRNPAYESIELSGYTSQEECIWGLNALAAMPIRLPADIISLIFKFCGPSKVEFNAEKSAQAT